MKKKIVVQLQLPRDKDRVKAMKTAVSATGVSSVAVVRKDGGSTYLVIMGDAGLDAVALTDKLRKATGQHVDLVRVAEVADDDEEDDDDVSGLQTTGGDGNNWPNGWNHQQSYPYYPTAPGMGYLPWHGGSQLYYHDNGW